MNTQQEVLQKMYQQPVQPGQTSHSAARPAATSTPPSKPKPKNNGKAGNIFFGVVVAIILIPTVAVLFFAFVPGASNIFQGKPKPSPTPLAKASLTPTSLPTSTPVASPTPSPSASPSPSPKVSPSPTPKVSPSPSVSPTPVANTKIDLSVEDVKVEDPQNEAKLDAPYYAGQRLSLRATLKNNGSQDSGTFESYWTIDGTKVGVNSNGKVKANSTAAYDDVNSLVYSNFFLQKGKHTLSYVTDNDNKLQESNRGNNSKSIDIEVGDPRVDLEPVEFVYTTPNSAVSDSVTPTIGVPIKVQVRFKNNGANSKSSRFLIRWSYDGQVQESAYTGWVVDQPVLETTGYTFTPKAGTTLKVELNVTNPLPETNTGNNSKTQTF